VEKTGKVLKVFPTKYRVIVEGINLRKRHTKPKPEKSTGWKLEKEASIHASNVMILDPKSNEPTVLGRGLFWMRKQVKRKLPVLLKQRRNDSIRI